MKKEETTSHTIYNFGQALLTPMQIGAFVNHITKPSKLLDWLVKIEADKIDAQAIAMTQPLTEVCMRDNPFPYTTKSLHESWWHPDAYPQVTGPNSQGHDTAVFACPHCSKQWYMKSVEYEQFLKDPSIDTWREFFTTQKKEKT